jgi:hypothetical protein
MYAFLLFSLPLAFLLLVIRLYPKAEYRDTKTAFLRGLIAALPIWLIARLLGSIVPELPGSFLQVFHEWADRFLPYAILPALAYPVFYRYDERLTAGAAQRRLGSFYAGSLCLTGLGETLRLWGSAGAYQDLVLPFLVAALALALPRIVLGILSGYGARRFLAIAGGIAASLALSAVLPLFLAQLWPLALVLAAGLAAGAWFLALPGLRAS